jgi:hypothetical protein
VHAGDRRGIEKTTAVLLDCVVFRQNDIAVEELMNQRLPDRGSLVELTKTTTLLHGLGKRLKSQTKFPVGTGDKHWPKNARYSFAELAPWTIPPIVIAAKPKLQEPGMPTMFPRRGFESWRRRFLVK